jgi:hypothetical protein
VLLSPKKAIDSFAHELGVNIAGEHAPHLADNPVIVGDDVGQLLAGNILRSRLISSSACKFVREEVEREWNIFGRSRSGGTFIGRPLIFSPSNR